MTEELEKQLALMNHLGEEYFLTEEEEIAWEGNLAEIEKQFVEEGNDLGTDDFGQWVRDTCIMVQEYDENDSNYLVLTDEEADEKTLEYIRDSLWAFNPGFLSDVTGLDKMIFEAIQSNEKCEDNNEPILQLIEATTTLEEVAEEAVRADKRAHYLNTYDREEHEIFINNTYYFIYRVN